MYLKLIIIGQEKIPPPERNEQLEQVSIFEQSINNEYGYEQYESSFGNVELTQKTFSDSSIITNTDKYTFGDSNDPELTIERTENPITGEKEDNVNIKATDRVNIYNTNNYDNNGRLTQTKTGAEISLYKEKNQEGEIDKKFSFYGEYTKPQLGDNEPQTNFGFTYKNGNSSITPKITNNGARNINASTLVGATNISVDWQKETGINNISMGGDIGHGTNLTVNSNPKDKNYSATLIHKKESKNENKNPITEFVNVNYTDRDNCSIDYSVDNKGITNWGISAARQDGNNRFGAFFNTSF